MIEDSLRARTATEGAFITTDESTHFATGAKILDDSGEATVKNVLDDDIYDNGAYVAILSDDEACPFWIVMVHSNNKNNKGATIGLTVHWLQAMDGTYNCTYSSDLIYGRRKKREPCLGTVSIESFIITFKDLTSRH